MKKKNQTELKRYHQEPEMGLDDIAVKDRIERGLTNKVKLKSTKSLPSIFFKNICTFYNLIWLLILVALSFVGAFDSMLFIIIVVANTGIAIFQEIKAKITVEKLSLVSAPKITVIRNGEEIQLSSEKLVLDDIIKLTSGNEIPADSIIISGDIEVNESMLTGEANARKKTTNSHILAGSFLVSGVCYARIDKIGKDNYIHSITKEAKKFKSPSSNLFKDINNLVRVIGFIVMPIMGALMFLKEFMKTDLTQAILSTSSSLIGMIPAGMFLLITVALQIGVLKLSRKQTLVQNSFSVEMLARANILCLDKTGTLTDGTMEVVNFIPFIKEEKATQILQEILGAQTASNMTSNALLEKFGSSATFKLKSKMEFSSERKCSVTNFALKGSFLLGASSHVHPKLSQEQKELIDSYAKQGLRVMLLVQSNTLVEDAIPTENKPIAMLVIEEHIRPDATTTIEWFKNNGVEIKIISGDDPISVSSIAKRVGVQNAEKCISLDGLGMAEIEPLAMKFTVFGRVSPEQKQMLIKAMRNRGNIVAMTGDGVNDTLAIKEADCSIAMAEGSAAARNLANMVLLDSKFASLPAVVNEGRQVINNVQQSSVLFLMKTIFTILLTLVSLITFTRYPFTEPNQMFLMEMLVIGIPSVILALQPNSKPIKGEFISNVLKQSVPFALLMFLNIFSVVIMGHVGTFDPNSAEFMSLVTLSITVAGLINLIRLCFPLTPLRIGCLITSTVATVVIASVMPTMFRIHPFPWQIAVVLIVQAIATSFLMLAVPRIVRTIKRIRAREYRH